MKEERRVGENMSPPLKPHSFVSTNLYEIVQALKNVSLGQFLQSVTQKVPFKR